ncbi:MAG: 3D-(3,5/4)-trihydroxycyclohexane-1,2-dione acylhydrolase (decyclizing) [Proteobacteria bacterium]|nr:3D-(3,5/4)-trihydroxycyclohexane-1,2-dione acylhydrolase (decyclizing) [Pseudomonadota bacterium]MDA0854909.1 3D-(3,5/4)-trihydroxycyclohexane-1,2-dione acylhydrolase (decyclizing) [Pseudomonadota bacterium]
MKTIRLTMAQALVRYLVNQHTMIDGKKEPLFPGVFAIFGHGNVTCLGEALESVRDVMPTWRGQNEQSMGLAAVAFAKASRRRQIMVATSSIGPGCTNFLTAAGTAHSNRLPVLFLSGDTFSNRLPDPVLQQVEHFQDPTLTVADAFKSCTRFWDRITHPAQLMVSLPQAVATMMDPATSGPAFIALPQDIQAVAYDYPEVFFEEKIHRSPRPRPDQDSIAEAAAILKSAQKPMIVAGGGVFYSGAVATLTSFAEKHGIPVTETIAGRSQMLHDHKLNAGPLGVIGSSSANALAAEADVVLAVGTRLQDFTTGSWSVFGNESMQLIAINAASFDAHKHRAISVVGDAKVGLEDLSSALGNWAGSPAWIETAQGHYAEWNRTVDQHSGPSDAVPPSYGQVVGAINRSCDSTDLALTAAGGLPGELCKNWKTRSIGTFDCEFGFSCMGYEIAGGWGAKMADPSRDVIVFVGDGSYLMLNSDIYSTVLTGHKMIVIVCDNGGFSVINRLQNFKGSASFNNLLQDCKVENLQGVDFVQHATSMGALGEQVESIAELEAAFKRAKAADRTYVICIKTQPSQWTPGDAWWDVGVPEVSDREEVRQARSDHSEGQKRQRLGV